MSLSSRRTRCEDRLKSNIFAMYQVLRELLGEAIVISPSAFLH
jgi:hypothetical protein